MSTENHKQPQHGHRIDGTIFGPTAKKTYDDLITRCRHRIRQLTTIQFDEETGIQRHYFNGKLERITQVRGIKKD